MVGTTSAAERPVRGTLTIDFHAQPLDEIAQSFLDREIKIRIPNQGRLAGLRIPRNIDGQPFRGQEFSLSLVPNGCVLDGGPARGQAVLRLTQKERRQSLQGSVFKAPVFNGQYECLFGGASQVLPYDPFDGNHQTSVIGELVIWWTQILSAQLTDEDKTVKDEVYRFFEIDNSQAVHRLRFRGVEYHSVQSPVCKSDSPHLHCNRGGSAEGMFSADVRVKFRERELR